MEGAASTPHNPVLRITPLGWLCTKITAAADSRTTGAKTSRGWTIDAVSDPRDTETVSDLAVLVVE
jgi:hypothetical protein